MEVKKEQGQWFIHGLEDARSGPFMTEGDAWEHLVDHYPNLFRIVVSGGCAEYECSTKACARIMLRSLSVFGLEPTVRNLKVRVQFGPFSVADAMEQWSLSKPQATAGLKDMERRAKLELRRSGFGVTTG